MNREWTPEEQNRIAENLSAFYDGEAAAEVLPPEVREDLDHNHDLKTYRFLSTALTELPEIQPSDDLRERVFRTMNTTTTIPTERTAPPRTKRPAPISRIWKVAAVLLVGVALLAAYFALHQPTPAPVTAPAATVASVDADLVLLGADGSRTPLEPGAPLHAGERIETLDGDARIDFENGTWALLRHNTAISIQGPDRARFHHGEAEFHTGSAEFAAEFEEYEARSRDSSYTLETGANGKVELDRQSGTVRLYKDGRQVGSVEASTSAAAAPSVPEVPPGDTNTDPRGIIAGIITGADGEPVAGATVERKHAFLHGGPPAFESHADVPTTRTDGQGRYGFHDVPDGHYDILAEGEGLAPNQLSNVAVEGGETVVGMDLALQPGVVFEVQTVDAEGAPIPSVEIYFYGVQELVSPLRMFRTAFTDEDGVARFNASADTQVHLWVPAEDYVMTTWSSGEAPATFVRLVLEDGHALRGVVLSDSGLPVPGARLYAQRIGETLVNNRYATRNYRTAQTDNTGAFTLPHLPDGEYILVTMAEGYWAAESDPITLREEDVEGVELALDPGPAFYGRVMDTGGRPVAGALVMADDNHNRPGRANHTFSMRPVFDAHEDPFRTGTDSDGWFKLPSLFPGTESLMVARVDDDGIYNRQVAAQPEESPHEIVLGATHLVEIPLLAEGVVVGEDGRPAWPCQLTVKIEYGQYRSMTSPRHVTDQRGRFQIYDMDRPYENQPQSATELIEITIDARSEDGGTGTTQFQTTRGNPVSDILLRLEDGPAIAGTVRDPAGEPLEGARVVARPLEVSPHAIQLRLKQLTTITDASGQFRIRGLDAGEVMHVGAVKEGYGLGYALYVKPDGDALELTLSPPITAAGRVMDGEGEPVSGATVRARIVGHDDQGLQGLADAFPGSRALSGPDGEFVLDLLGPDHAQDYSIHAELGNRESAGVAVRLSPGDAHEGLVLTLYEGAVLEGRIVDAVTGEPIEGARIRGGEGPRAPNSNYPLLARSDAEGRFRLEGLPREAFTVHLEAEGYVYAEDIFAQTLSGNETLTDLTWEMEPAAVFHGVCVDADGQPLEGVRVHLHGGDAQSSRAFLLVPENEDRSGINEYGHPVRNAKTGPDGRFEVHGLPAGSQARVSFQKEGYTYRSNTTSNYMVIEAPTAEAGTEASPQEFEFQTWEPPTYTSISGTVVDESGQPFASGTMKAMLYQETQQVEYSTEIVDGRFHFDRVLPGTCTVQLGTPRYESDATEKFEVTVGAPVTGIHVVARRASGKNLNFFQVTITSDLKDLNRAGYGTVRLVGDDVFEEHHFVSTRLPQTFDFDFRYHPKVDAVILTVAMPGAAPIVKAGISLPTEDFALQLVEPGTVTGRVLDALTGEPIPVFQVRVNHPVLGPASTWTKGYGGEFAVREMVGDGEVTLSISAPGYLPVSSDAIRTRAGATVGAGTYRLQPGARVRGRVLGDHNSSVSGAEVIFHSEHAPESWASAKTRADGTFEVDGLRAGSQMVSVRHKDYADIERREVLVSPDAETDALTLQLGHGGSIEGTVYDNSGEPAHQATVRIDSQEPITTDNEGRFRVDNLPEATVRITGNIIGRNELTPLEVHIAEGKVQRIELRPRWENSRFIEWRPLGEQ